ncbi:MAG: YkgJ family cysteine cluster protein [Proteobacteria bacterium]|nr:YkgJ family cysteine cluster protein [Pseudomonadota bacterium]MBU4469209.1 YkgJ family cysteine cluster protein [Pseudomonadota bacterium]MCG2752240.1 YkgJ family cysteine cluster protein [Desulfobacteraceae bacterium]
MNDDPMIPLSPDDSFSFDCSSKIGCFNECCRDLNQFLTPYDVLRIKQVPGMSSSGFLEQYCGQHAGPESGLPVVTLKPADPLTLVCPFVSPDGCTIYQHRPSSCRMYPLMRAVSRSRGSGRLTEYFALLKESHCMGHEQNQESTVSQWIKNQGLLPYNDMNDKLLEVISLKNRICPGPMDVKTSRFCFMALYDLDPFRRHVFEKSILKDMTLDENLLEKARTDDVALLTLGMEAIKQLILKEP